MEKLIKPVGTKFFVGEKEFDNMEDAIAHIKLSLETKNKFDKASYSSSFHKFQNKSVEEFEKYAGAII